MSQPTAEDRMGTVAKGCAGMIVAGVCLLLAVAVFAFMKREARVPPKAPVPAVEQLKN